MVRDDVSFSRYRRRRNLNSPRAVEMSVYIVRAFVKLRQVLASNAELARKLAALEKSAATLDASARKQFEEVIGPSAR